MTKQEANETRKAMEDIMQKPTQVVSDTKAAIEVLLIVGMALREARSTTLGGIPSGHLYSLLQGVVSLEGYYAMIRKLVEMELVRESNHLLTWIGGE